MRGHGSDQKNRWFSRSRLRAGAPSRQRSVVRNGQRQGYRGRFDHSEILLKLWLVATLPFVRPSARRRASEPDDPSANTPQRASPERQVSPDLDEAERLARVRRTNAAAAKDEAAAEKLRAEAKLLPLTKRETELRIGNLELDCALKIVGLGIAVGTLVAAFVIGILDLGQLNGKWPKLWKMWEISP